MRIEHFQFIDRIESIDDVPARLRAAATVPARASIFEGHFPGYPLMPGVLLIETMAQAAGYLLLARNGFTRMPFLVSVKEAKLRSFVEPSSLLAVEAEIEHEGSGYAISRTRVHHKRTLICNAQLAMRLMPFPAASLKAYLESHARTLGLPERTAP